MEPTRLPCVIDENSASMMFVSHSSLASAIGLTADKIKAGETILGITGTYTGEIDVSL